MCQQVVEHDTSPQTTVLRSPIAMLADPRTRADDRLTDRRQLHAQKMRHAEPRRELTLFFVLGGPQGAPGVLSARDVTQLAASSLRSCSDDSQRAQCESEIARTEAEFKSKEPQGVMTPRVISRLMKSLGLCCQRLIQFSRVESHWSSENTQAAASSASAIVADLQG